MSSKKDAYWFKHDSTSGRGLRLRKIQHIYTHWGKGVYWDVIEILRDQSGYKFEKDDSSLQMLSDLIGCKDDKKFISWFNDCVRMEIFLTDDKYFYSEVLIENMAIWETKKANGSKVKKKVISETEAKPKRNGKRTGSIREEKSIEEKSIIPSEPEFLAYCQTIKEYPFSEYGFSIKAKYESWVDNGWKDGNNKPIKNWKSKIKNTLPFLTATKPKTTFNGLQGTYT